MSESPETLPADANGLTLPLYTPSIARAPSYAAEPPNGEQRLAHTTRSRVAQPVPQGSFTTRTGNIIIILKEQEPKVTTPTFGRNAVIRGEVQVQEESVLLVSLKV